MSSEKALNVSPAKWQRMCECSRRLLSEADQANRRGDLRRRNALWRKLAPLNRQIRALSEYPADGSRP